MLYYQYYVILDIFTNISSEDDEDNSSLKIHETEGSFIFCPLEKEVAGKRRKNNDVKKLHLKFHTYELFIKVLKQKKTCIYRPF